MLRTGFVFVAALAAMLAAGAAEFDSALPVWPEGETETLNAFFTFRCEFDAASGDDVRLRATAGYVYKAGNNVVEIDVAGYNCPNFYLAKQTPFLQAELLVNGKVVAATAILSWRRNPDGSIGVKAELPDGWSKK